MHNPGKLRTMFLQKYGFLGFIVQTVDVSLDGIE